MHSYTFFIGLGNENKLLHHSVNSATSSGTIIFYHCSLSNSFLKGCCIAYAVQLGWVWYGLLPFLSGIINILLVSQPCLLIDNLHALLKWLFLPHPLHICSYVRHFINPFYQYYDLITHSFAHIAYYILVVIYLSFLPLLNCPFNCLSFSL